MNENTQPKQNRRIRINKFYYIEKHNRLLYQASVKSGEDARWRQWLCNSAKFDQRLRLFSTDDIDRANQLLNALMKNERRRKTGWSQKQTDLNVLCANLLTNKTRKPTAISLNRNDYVLSDLTRNVTSDFTRELVKLLENNDYIKLVKGYNFAYEKRLSRIWPTDKLLAYFPKDADIDFEPSKLVILRNKEKKDIAFEDNLETKKIRNILQKANEINSKAVVRIKASKKLKRLSTNLYCIFNNSTFKHGGRLYTGKFGYQNIPPEERPLITINGNPTVELDFSGMHPRLLYAMKGIQYPHDEDPYSAICDAIELRPFLKILLLALLNTDNFNSAIAAGNYKLHKKQEFYRVLKRIKATTKELIERFKAAHPEISDLFCQNIGFELMRQDSKIALDVVHDFVKKRRPILAIHDSFIVEAKWKEELKQVMQLSYKRNTKFECPIK